jgi:hypothetical protein
VPLAEVVSLECWSDVGWLYIQSPERVGWSVFFEYVRTYLRPFLARDVAGLPLLMASSYAGCFPERGGSQAPALKGPFAHTPCVCFY